MDISVVNRTGGKVADEEVQRVLRVVNTQIAGDFAPYWSLSATLRLEGKVGRRPKTQELADLRGDAILYLWDQDDVEGAIGYHYRNARGIPYGFVFTEIARELGEPWSVTLSHEALELIGDPEVNVLAMGPHPKEKRWVFHWYEMCDAVQAETYEIDGVAVSNFVLPLYFTGEQETGGRNDFLGRKHARKTLRSFGVNPGGFIGFYDPKTGKYDKYRHRGDEVAAHRMSVKERIAKARRGGRYQRFDPAVRIPKVAR